MDDAYRLRCRYTSDSTLTFTDLIREARDTEAFGSFFSGVLLHAPFQGVYWECPPVTHVLIASGLFECKAVSTTGSTPASDRAFAENFVGVTETAGHSPAWAVTPSL